MKITCNKCGSDNLDQGIDDKILCHNCKGLFYLIATWTVPDLTLRDIES